MKSTMLLSHLKNCFLYIHSMSNHQTPTVYIYIDYWSVLSSSSQLDIWPDLLSKERGQLELLLYETCSALRDVRYYQLCSPPVGLEGKLFGKVQHTDWTREISPILCVRVCVCAWTRVWFGFMWVFMSAACSLSWRTIGSVNELLLGERARVHAVCLRGLFSRQNESLRWGEYWFVSLINPVRRDVNHLATFWEIPLLLRNRQLYRSADIH